MALPMSLDLWVLCWKQWLTERSLLQRGLNLRTTAGDRVSSAYRAMTAAEFDVVNSRQEWANERVIPKLLGDKFRRGPIRALDLGCGTGGSTQALASCCPPQSTIFASEQASHLIETARRRSYVDRTGKPVQVIFCCQSIVEPLCDDASVPLAEGSIDVVNSSGVIGHHFNSESLEGLLSELRRVVCPRGIVALDSGPTLSSSDLTEIMEEFGGRKIDEMRSFAFARSAQIAFEMSARF